MAFLPTNLKARKESKTSMIGIDDNSKHPHHILASAHTQHNTHNNEISSATVFYCTPNERFIFFLFCFNPPNHHPSERHQMASAIF